VIRALCFFSTSSYDTATDLPPIDTKWTFTAMFNQELNLYNTRTHQNVRLGFDHVREYMTDIARSDGFLLPKS
jgi:hypothetical protein